MSYFEELVAGLSPEERKQLEREVEDARAYLPLAAVREKLSITQKELAVKLGVTQPNVSRMESQNDVLLSTLFRYVVALGGKASVRLDFDKDRFVIDGERDLTGAPEKPTWVFKLKDVMREPVVIAISKWGSESHSRATPHVQSIPIYENCQVIRLLKSRPATNYATTVGATR